MHFSKGFLIKSVMLNSLNQDKMYAFTLLVLSVVSVSCGKLNAVVKPSFPEGRIINGLEADRGEAPFIVSFKTNNHFCAGSIIAENWILTAAHCLIHDNFDIIAGLHSRDNEVDIQIRTVTSKDQQIKHEQYGGSVGPHDIGLVYIQKPFVFNTLTRDGTTAVSKISLPSKNSELYGEGKLFGWGRDNLGSLSSVLQTLDVNIISFEECKTILPPFDPLDPVNICTYTNGTSDGACNGDSGGPLVRKSSEGTFKLVGLVSWGYTPCATTTLPSIYTSTIVYDKWIKEKMNNYKI